MPIANLGYRYRIHLRQTAIRKPEPVELVDAAILR